jgi:hypothetical protein
VGHTATEPSSLSVIARRPEIPCRFAALRELVGIGEHGGAADAAEELRSVRRLLLSVDQDAVIALVMAYRALKPGVVVASFLTDTHSPELIERSFGYASTTGCGPSHIATQLRALFIRARIRREACRGS